MRINSNNRAQNKQNKILLFRPGIDITPEVIKNKKINLKDNPNPILNIVFKCTVNKKEMQKLNCAYIDALISDKNIDYYSQKGKRTARSIIGEGINQRKFANIGLRSSANQNKTVLFPSPNIGNQSQNRGLTPILAIAAISKVTGIKKETNRNLYEDSKFIGRFRFEKIKKERKYTLDENTSNFSYSQNIISEYENNLSNTFNAFKRFYVKNKFSHVYDTMSFFQEGYDASARLNKSHGLNSNVNKKDLIFKIDDLKKAIIQRIKVDSNKIESEFKLSKVKTEKIIDNLTLNRKIRLDKLRSFGSDFYLILVAKKANGSVIERFSYKINLQDILNQLATQSIDYNINTFRNSRDISGLLIQSSNYNPASVSVLAKSIDPSMSLSTSYYHIIDKNIFLNDNSNIIKVINGTVSSKTSKSKGEGASIKYGHDAFYRTLLCLNGSEYSNSKCASDKTKKKNKNFPIVHLTTTVFSNEGYVEIQLKNIPENISAIKIIKRKIIGGKPRKYQSIFNLEGTPVGYKSSPGNGSLTFVDYDVSDDDVYEYQAICMMSNGEIKTANHTFLEYFEEASNIVNIENIEITTQQGDSTSSLGEESEIQIKGSFTLNKIETDADKVLMSLFGNAYDLLKDDLANIKDVSNLIYSVEIVRINRSKGTSKTVDKIILSEGGVGNFNDRISGFDDNSYKFIPRVSLGTELISQVNETIEKMGKENFRKKSRFLFSANRRRGLFFKNKKISSVDKKVSNKNFSLRGRIESKETTTERLSSDMFKDGSTGDIVYYDVPSLIANTSDITITQSKIDKIRYSSLEKEKITKYSVVNFNILNDANIDYYIFCIKEDDNVFIDGTIHSINSLSGANYKYLVKHDDLVGAVNYYIVPVFKSGLIGESKLVITEDFEE